MNVLEIAGILDDYFNTKRIPPDMPFSVSLPKKYGLAGVDYRQYFTEQFCDTFHGLAIKNSDTAKKICCAVFLSEEVLDFIFQAGESDVLIFVHHPMDLETRNRGTVPLQEKYFHEMKARRISVYAIHTPLDIHEEISTSGSVARHIGLEFKQRYDKNSIGYSGVVGELPLPMAFEEFIQLLEDKLAIKNIYFEKKRDHVQRVGVIAGGGTLPQFMLETEELGCDTYVTGDYLNNIQNVFGDEERIKFSEMKGDLSINLIACSHYATEKTVIQNEIMNFFRNREIPCEFIGQQDPWK